MSKRYSVLIKIDGEIIIYEVGEDGTIKEEVKEFEAIELLKSLARKLELRFERKAEQKIGGHEIGGHVDDLLNC